MKNEEQLIAGIVAALDEEFSETSVKALCLLRSFARCATGTGNEALTRVFNRVADHFDFGDPRVKQPK